MSDVNVCYKTKRVWNILPKNDRITFLSVYMWIKGNTVFAVLVNRVLPLDSLLTLTVDYAVNNCKIASVLL